MVITERYQRRHLIAPVVLVVTMVVWSTVRMASWMEPSVVGLTMKTVGETTEAHTKPTVVTTTSSTGFQLPRDTGDRTKFQPRTKIDHGASCGSRSSLQSQQHQPVTTVDRFPAYEDPTRYYNSNCHPHEKRNGLCYGRSSNNRTTTTKTTIEEEQEGRHVGDGIVEDMDVCRLHADKKDSLHFPHVMQQLYACYTYWQRFRGQRQRSSVERYRSMDQSISTQLRSPSATRRILLVSSSKASKDQILQKLHRNAFLDGFLQLLQHQLNVTAMSYDEVFSSGTTTKTATMVADSATHARLAAIQDFGHDVLSGGYILSNVIQLNQLVMMVKKHDDQTSNGSSSTPLSNANNIDISTSSSIRNCVPTIGLLNRKTSSGRSILNAKDLLTEIQSKFLEGKVSVHSNKDGNDENESHVVNVNVEPEYFELGQSFLQQVEFFQSVDILISPHGAQLAGLPFLGFHSYVDQSRKQQTHQRQRGQQKNRPIDGLSQTNSTTESAALNMCQQGLRPYLLEVFPENYFIPHFFGSLAVNSNIRYNHLYSSPYPPPRSAGTTTAANASVSSSPPAAMTMVDRQTARAQNICLDPYTIMNAVTTMVNQWMIECRQCVS